METPVPNKPTNNKKYYQINAIDLARVKDLEKKSHISILLELLQKQRITPTYELVGVKGAPNDRMFWYRVWYNDNEAIGVGISKQEAKQSAAKALIDKFTGVSDLVTKISTKINGDIGNLNTSIESNIFGNPIGWVKEFCTARRWPQPIYKIESKLVLSKETQFTIACVVSKYREVGHRTSQKNAKRMAANKMWDKIQKSALANSKANEDIDGEYNRTRGLAKF